MSESRRKEAVENFYTCGRCGLQQEYLQSEEPPKTCRDCGWPHFERKPDSVPSEVKIQINQYG